MKKIALITLLAIVSLFIVSCRRELTHQEKAEDAVTRHLDSVYDGNVKIVRFKDFTTLKAYAEQSNKEYYERWLKKHPEDSVSKKDFEQQAAYMQIGMKNWYNILCFYDPRNLGPIGENFFISPDFKKVKKQHIVE